MREPELRDPIIYIGPDKAASTWVFELLRNHPEVSVPSGKELFFFDQNFHLGMDWYHSQFSSGGRALDVSHDYLFHPLAPPRIQRSLTTPRLVVGVRDPLDRAISAYRFLQYQGRLNRSDSFDVALSKEPELIRHGLIGSELDKWVDLFGVTPFVFVDFAGLAADQAATAESLCGSLGLAWPDGNLELPGRANPARSSRLPAGVVSVGRSALVKMRNRGFVGAASKVKSIGAAVASNRSAPSKVDVSGLLLDDLSAMFQADLAHLNSVFGTDFVYSVGPRTGDS